MRFIATGDTILTGYYTKDYAGHRALAEFIRSADVRFNNMETPLVDDWCTVSAFSGGHWIRTPTSRLDDLADFGFNCFSFANNHGLDFFYTGLLSTIRAFRARGLAFAGAGEDLESATRHCKVETPNGSLALVALTTTCEPSCIAGPPSGAIPGRPGVGMLRHSAKYFVSAEQMAALRAVAEDTKVNGRIKNRRALGSVVVDEGTFPFGPLSFEVGPAGRMTYPDPYDTARYEKAVKAAAADADRTVVYIHTHETKGESDAEPDFFVETFARSCLDWGADAVICSGTHQVKGVEIYDGKPIFYSIANFCFRATDLDYYPLEWYEKYKLDKSLTIREAENVRSKGGTIGLLTQAYNFRAIAPLIEWDDAGSAVKIAALPIGLGFHEPMDGTKGFPRIGDAEDTAALLGALTKTCAPYGTRVTLGEDGLFTFTKA